ncbi:hypothetical protein D3C77_543590 [compost metagenome]
MVQILLLSAPAPLVDHIVDLYDNGMRLAAGKIHRVLAKKSGQCNFINRSLQQMEQKIIPDKVKVIQQCIIAFLM